MGKLKELLDIAQGSDIYIVSESIPMVRQNRQIKPVEGQSALSHQVCLEMKQDILSHISQRQNNEFIKKKQGFFAYQKCNHDRYRGYLREEDNHIEIHLHHIPSFIPTIDDLGLPKNIAEIATYTEGLILISGPTGSGRSTTAASLIQHWNQTRNVYIVTLERILEHQITSQKSLIHQREFHKDWEFVTEGLLKQNIDICFLSDVYNNSGYLSTLDMCTGGCLVVATTFATSAVDCIDQFLGNTGSSSWVAKRLSTHLKAVIHQRLIPGKLGQPILIAEVLLPTMQIRKLIQDQDLHPIYDLMRKDQNRTGMVTLNQSLMNALIKRKTELRTAFSISPDPNELDHLLKKVGI